VEVNSSTEDLEKHVDQVLPESCFKKKALKHGFKKIKEFLFTY
jgi:hypothetical protein